MLKEHRKARIELVEENNARKRAQVVGRRKNGTVVGVKRERRRTGERDSYGVEEKKEKKKRRRGNVRAPPDGAPPRPRLDARAVAHYPARVTQVRGWLRGWRTPVEKTACGAGVRRRPALPRKHREQALFSGRSALGLRALHHLATPPARQELRTSCVGACPDFTAVSWPMTASRSTTGRRARRGSCGGRLVRKASPPGFRMLSRPPPPRSRASRRGRGPPCGDLHIALESQTSAPGRCPSWNDFSFTSIRNSDR